MVQPPAHKVDFTESGKGVFDEASGNPPAEPVSGAQRLAERPEVPGTAAQSENAAGGIQQSETGSDAGEKRSVLKNGRGNGGEKEESGGCQCHRQAAAVDPPPRGLASLFEKSEIKDLFRSYLVVMCVIEGFIFFVNFMTQLGPESVPFPWKSYFFAAFSIPLAITFLLGIIVISFDRYIFGYQGLGEEADEFFQTAAETRSRIHKLHAFLYVIRQAPFLIGLLVLVALSAVAYKLDVILAVIGHVGERTAQYIFVSLSVVFAVGVGVGLIWLFLNYSLRKKAMEFEYQYRKDVVEKTGLVFVSGDRMMDSQGRMLPLNQARRRLTRRPEDDSSLPALVIEPEGDE